MQSASRINPFRCNWLWQFALAVCGGSNAEDGEKALEVEDYSRMLEFDRYYLPGKNNGKVRVEL
jgi:hypothetical protein